MFLGKPEEDNIPKRISEFLFWEEVFLDLFEQFNNQTK